MSHPPADSDSADWVYVCAERDVREPGAYGFELPVEDVIVVRTAGALFGYRNRCPHRGTTLDWAPGRLLSADGRHLQCATHAARFELDTGVCVAGPCQGDRLTPLPLRVQGGALMAKLG